MLDPEVAAPIGVDGPPQPVRRYRLIRRQLPPIGVDGPPQPVRELLEGKRSVTVLYAHAYRCLSNAYRMKACHVPWVVNS